MDIIILRGFERIIIVLGAIFIGYLGYRLYINGASVGKNTLKTNFGDVSLILTGIGPGIFFMAFGSLVLVAALYFGGAEYKSSKLQSPLTNSMSEERTVLTKGIYSGPNECNTEVAFHSSGMYLSNSGFDNKNSFVISLGDKVGVSWTINDNPRLDNLKFKFFHPEMNTGSRGYHLTSVKVGPDHIKNNKLRALWSFDTTEEIVEGEWSFELWCDRTRISSKKFTVSGNE